jgi:hypothetical protein
LYRHGEDTPYEAVEVIEDWERTAAERAAVVADRRLSGRARRRIGRFLWRAALDPDRKPPRIVERKFGGEGDRVVGATRDSLSAALIEAMDFDAQRFWSLVHNPVPEDRIVALDEAIAALLRATTGEPDHPAEARVEDMPDLRGVGEFSVAGTPVLAGPGGEAIETPDA